MLQKRKNRYECFYGCCRYFISKGTIRARENRLWRRDAE